MCRAIVKTGTFLDLDMTTLGHRVNDIWRWWTSEMSAMLPHRLRSNAKRIRGPIAYWRDDSTLWLNGEMCIADGDVPVRNAIIVIPNSICLIRSLHLPAMPDADLRKMVMLDIDRLTPFSADNAYADVSLSNEPALGGKRHLRIAAIQIDIAQDIAATARSCGLMPTALGVCEDDVMAFDFLPALRDDGSVAARSSAPKRWWTFVAILFALNFGLFIFLDVQSVNRLSELVESQSLSAVGARNVASRIAKEDRLRAEILTLRERSDALAQLALTTRQMPEGIWVQRYSASENVLRLAGYKQSTNDLLGSLRKSGRFTTIRASTSEGAPESGTGQPFDITAEVKVK